LKSFAGLDEIYINLNQQSSLYSELNEYVKSSAILILKLNSIRLIVHEMAYVDLRATTKDFNISTTSLKNSVYHEADYIAEERLFNERIDWLE
jgi:hypothetical protein